MSVFKNHKTVADRSASDRRRHKEKIKASDWLEIEKEKK